MFIRLILAAILLSLGSASAAVVYPSTTSPVGYWKTTDEMTGKPKNIIQVWRNADYTLMAKIVKVFPTAQAKQTQTCTACQGDQRNQPIIGMVILSGLKAGDNQWAQGHILDPENGKTYKCTVRLTDNGKKLNVHGYLGLPMFGRSQTWERVDLMSG